MKYTEYESLEHCLEDLKECFDGKANVGHTLESVNGLTVVVSDTAPDTDDETVITFVISSGGSSETYDYEITDVTVTSFLNTTAGTGRMVFLVTVDHEPNEDLKVAIVDETQGDSSLSAGNVYTGEAESPNCNLWYSEALTAGEHSFKVYLLDSSGNQVTPYYTFTRTAP